MASGSSSASWLRWTWASSMAVTRATAQNVGVPATSSTPTLTRVGSLALRSRAQFWPSSSSALRSHRMSMVGVTRCLLRARSGRGRRSAGPGGPEACGCPERSATFALLAADRRATENTADDQQDCALPAEVRGNGLRSTLGRASQDAGKGMLRWPESRRSGAQRRGCGDRRGRAWPPTRPRGGWRWR